MANAAFTGEQPVVVGGETLLRNWSRGDAFSLDGLPPGCTAQAHIANRVLLAELAGVPCIRNEAQRQRLLPQ